MGGRRDGRQLLSPVAQRGCVPILRPSSRSGEGRIVNLITVACYALSAGIAGVVGGSSAGDGKMTGQRGEPNLTIRRFLDS